MSKKNLSFSKDLYAEKLLKENQLNSRIKNIRLDDIDWESSKANHARLTHPVDEGHVSNLKTTMENGGQVPMLVVYEFKNKPAPLLIWSGNHRGPAIREINGVSEIPAYVVSKTDDKMLEDIMPKALNAPVREISVNERVLSAKDAVINYGMKPQVASRLFSVSEGSIIRQLRIERVKEELQAKNINASKLSPTLLDSLNSLTANTNVLAQAANVAINGRLTSTEIRDMVKRVQQRKNEVDQIAEISQIVNELGITEGIKKEAITINRSRSHKATLTKIRAALTTLEQNSKVRTLDQWGCRTTTEKEVFSGRIRKLCGKLSEICKRS